MFADDAQANLPRGSTQVHHSTKVNIDWEIEARLFLEISRAHLRTTCAHYSDLKVATTTLIFTKRPRMVKVQGGTKTDSGYQAPEMTRQ